MTRLSYADFMTSVGADPDDFRPVFAERRAGGHDRFENFLHGSADDDESCDVNHLWVFWDELCQRYVLDVLAAAVDPRAGGPARTTFDIVRRRLMSPGQLASFLEVLTRQAGRRDPRDPRLDRALRLLRDATPEAQTWSTTLARRFLASPQARRRLAADTTR